MSAPEPRSTLPLTFGVEVLFQLLLGDGALHARGRDFALGRPEDGVQDERAEVVVAPVLVGVAAGEAEASAAIGPLDGPGEHLVVSLGREDVLIRPTRRG